MAKNPKSGALAPLTLTALSAAVLDALKVSDFKAARAHLKLLLERDGSAVDPDIKLAEFQEKLGAVDQAAASLTQALARNPKHADAARRLAQLASSDAIEITADLSETGLLAALKIPGVARQPIIDLSLAQQLGGDWDVGPTRGTAAPGTWFAPKLDRRLSGRLLLAALEAGIVRQPWVEVLLTKIRSGLLLEMPIERFEHRDVTALALALMRQGSNNDFAWAVGPAEVQRLSDLCQAPKSSDALLASRQALLVCLYKPVQTVFGPNPSQALVKALQPRVLRDAVQERLDEHADELSRAQQIPRLRPIKDATSLAVARQYEASPYPRWHSLEVAPQGALKAALAARFGPARVSFMDEPFDVLIAGAGTGQQALQSATAYGARARVLALDLSAASLGYGQRMAERLGVANVTMLQGDILDLEELSQQHWEAADPAPIGPFDIIECVGVLHHMHDPWAGFRVLLRHLRPQGLMYIGLYSALSRRNIAALRAASDYPGPGCSDDQARDYRQKLFHRLEGQPGAELKTSRNFYALSEFRDLVLHESEQHVTLEEVQEFLAAEGLVFKGFTLKRSVLEDFASEQLGAPGTEGDGAPAAVGTLAQWAAYERKNPSTFDGMYCFWCERKGTGP